jgi:hypothetical protein
LTRVRVVLLAGALALLAGVVVAGSQRAYRLVGSNRVPAAGFYVRLRHARTLCQPALVPAGTGALRFLVGTYGRPLPNLTLVARGQVLGRLAGGGQQGWLEIPLRRGHQPLGATRLCVIAGGRRVIAVAGAGEVPASAARRARAFEARTPSGGRLGGFVRFEYVTRKPETWWSTIGASARRFALGKADWVGRWTLVLVGVLVLGALAVAGWTVGRERTP